MSALPNKSGPKGPHGKPRLVQGTLRQKAWRAMQIKGKFTLSDLVRNALADDAEAKDPRNNIGRYVKALCTVGILVEMKRRMAPTVFGSNGEKRWMLVRDLGRLAPTVRSLTEVYDPNSKMVIAAVIETEAGDAQ
ncbi:hypothetical protein [Azonexus sp.]|uniref:hypothetical protein n=1 Tax=Azonexus sp. TaxID=1872668 RepID=UPI0027BA6D11|nr:hypothetical protein [Azonexus sp.]